MLPSRMPNSLGQKPPLLVLLFLARKGLRALVMVVVGGDQVVVSVVGDGTLHLNLVVASVGWSAKRGVV